MTTFTQAHAFARQAMAQDQEGLTMTYRDYFAWYLRNSGLEQEIKLLEQHINESLVDKARIIAARSDKTYTLAQDHGVTRLYKTFCIKGDVVKVFTFTRNLVTGIWGDFEATKVNKAQARQMVNACRVNGFCRLHNGNLVLPSSNHWFVDYRGRTMDLKAITALISEKRMRHYECCKINDRKNAHCLAVEINALENKLR